MIRPDYESAALPTELGWLWVQRYQVQVIIGKSLCRLTGRMLRVDKLAEEDELVRA